MPIGEGTRAIMRELAREVVKELSDSLVIKWKEEQDRVAEVAKSVMTEHRNDCPTTKIVTRWQNQSKAFIIGVGIGTAMVGSGTTVGILKMVGII